jgi:hypothetical protein
VCVCLSVCLNMCVSLCVCGLRRAEGCSLVVCLRSPRDRRPVRVVGSCLLCCAVSVFVAALASLARAVRPCVARRAVRSSPSPAHFHVHSASTSAHTLTGVVVCGAAGGFVSNGFLLGFVRKIVLETSFSSISPQNNWWSLSLARSHAAPRRTARS